MNRNPLLALLASCGILATCGLTACAASPPGKLSHSVAVEQQPSRPTSTAHVVVPVLPQMQLVRQRCASPSADGCSITERDYTGTSSWQEVRRGLVGLLTHHGFIVTRVKTQPLGCVIAASTPRGRRDGAPTVTLVVTVDGRPPATRVHYFFESEEL